MTGQFCLYNGTPESLEHLDSFLKDMLIFTKDGRLKVQAKDASIRSGSQNSLYWVWLSQIAIFFSERSTEVFNKEDMHDWFRNQFLGTEDKQIGKTVIKGQLISTTSLAPPEMSEYMQKIDIWAQEKGIQLPVPADNEYMKYREAA